MIEKNIKYFKFVQNSSLFFALITAFWIPSYRWILSYFISASLLFSLLEFNFRKRLAQNLASNYIKILFALQLVLFLLVLSNVIFAEDFSKILKNVIQKLSLLIFPLLFALSGKLYKNKKDLFLKLFILSNIIMSFICIMTAFYNSLSYNEGAWHFIPYDINHFSYFTNSKLSIFHHRSYFSMYIVFSIAILFYFNEKLKFFEGKLKKTIFWFLLLFFMVMVFLLSSRAGMLSLFILFSVQIIRKIYFLKNTYYKILTVTIISLMIVFVFRNERINRTVNQILLFENKKQDSKPIKAPARIYLWKASTELIKENFLVGIGAEKFQSVFNKKYSEISGRDINDVTKQSLNAHNQFLEQFVKYGIFGFLLLISLFIYPIIVSFKRKNYLFLSFLLITGFNFLFESMLNTIAGIVFFAFFFNYFIFVFNEEDMKIPR